MLEENRRVGCTCFSPATMELCNHSDEAQRVRNKCRATGGTSKERKPSFKKLLTRIKRMIIIDAFARFSDFHAFSYWNDRVCMDKHAKKKEEKILYERYSVRKGTPVMNLDYFIIKRDSIDRFTNIFKFYACLFNKGCS